MNSKFTSIAAALVAKAGTNASAGIGANSSLDPQSHGHRKRVTSCTNDSFNPESLTNPELTSSSCKHQIGTNLSDLSVCWHKMTCPEHCSKCGEPFYRANQFVCEKCDTEDDLIAGTLRNEFFEGNKGGLTKNQAFSNSGTLDSLFSSIAPVAGESEGVEILEKSVQELPLVEYLTRKNFEDEFSSLIINSTCGSNNFLSEFQSVPKHVITKSIASVPSFLTDKDLLGQIKLYNKYNNSIFTELKYEQDEEDSINVSGLLKIHWHLKQPIQLSTTTTLLDDESDHSLTSNKSDKQTDFKATLINTNTQSKKKSCYDDSSINRKLINARRSSETNANRNGNPNKAHTVNYKPNKWKRPALNLDTTDTTDEAQKFIPAYASVSSIRIDNRVTCLNAIQILLDKYHIVDPVNKYSLYKCYQSGEVRELGDSDLPLVERIWMGPFSEDKIFVMEKGRQLNTNQEVSNLVSLPEGLLQSLLENLNQEEIKEINNITSSYLKYKEFLLNSLEDDFNENKVTKCSM